MTNLLNHWSLGDQRVHVAFYLHEDEGHGAQRSKLAQTVDRIFPEGARKLELGDSSADELAYELRTPVIRDDDDFTREFFERLRELFDSTAEFSPHYTQIPTDELGRVLPHD